MNILVLLVFVLIAVGLATRARGDKDGALAYWEGRLADALAGDLHLQTN
jgi:hypothetical protein